MQCFYQHLCLVDSEVLRNPPLRQAANRYVLLPSKSMNKIYLLIVAAYLTSCLTNDGNKLIHKTGEAEERNASSLHPDTSTSEWSDLKMYVGTYSKQTDFFENPIIKTELKRILDKDWKDYQEHIVLSACGETKFKYGLIYGDVSQMHVGGFSSLFFVDVKSEKIYLFWLDGAVGDKDYKIYGDRPIPSRVLHLIEEEMNTGWGHVATFVIKGDRIDIHPK